jgi:hypothetical protein
LSNLLDSALEILRCQRRLNTSSGFNVSRSCKELPEDGGDMIHRFDPHNGHAELRACSHDPGVLTDISLLLEEVLNDENTGDE